VTHGGHPQGPRVGAMLPVRAGAASRFHESVWSTFALKCGGAGPGCVDSADFLERKFGARGRVGHISPGWIAYGRWPPHVAHPQTWNVEARHEVHILSAARGGARLCGLSPDGAGGALRRHLLPEHGVLSATDL